jgi:peptidoglycan-N-acetylglucosamine deacetylase
MREKLKIAQMGVIAGLAAGAYSYAALYPTSQLFGQTLISGSDPNEIALTFDDGPNDPYTSQLLDLLARYEVRAMFFLMGKYVRHRPDLARAIHRAGHLIGNHTMSHPSLMWERPSRVREELVGCNAVLEDAIGERVEWFRPPFGARRPDVLLTARELGLTPVMWNVTAHDWDAVDADPLAERVRRIIAGNRRLGRGSNVLLHDGGHLRFGTDRSITLTATAMLLRSWAGTEMRVVRADRWKA